MTCPTCLSWLGVSRTHDKPCPVKASTWCTQCGQFGHRTIDCENKITWKRPESLEELIPEDVRKRWGITTKTLIYWPAPTTEVAESEISNHETIVIVKKDSKIREFMKQNKISTVHKMEGNIVKLREWAVENGKKIRWAE